MAMQPMFEHQVQTERFQKADGEATAPGASAVREACPVVRGRGQGPGDKSFDVPAYTLHANENGGELMLSAPVHPGQDLLLVNESSQAWQPCRIASAQRRGPRTQVIAVTFPAPRPEFWGVHGVPETQKARELELAMFR